METKGSTSHTKVRPSYVAAALLFIFGIWMFYPALSLPLSLIDDFAMLNNLDRWVRDYQEHGFTTALKNDVSVSQQIYNSGFWILSALKFRLSGGHPFHWLRLLEFTWVCFMMWHTIRLVVNYCWESFLGASLAVVLFIVSEVPYGIDMQSLRANWYRLFTSDADGTFFLATHIYCVAQTLRQRKQLGSLIGWATAGTACAVAAFSIKLPFVAVACGSLTVLALTAWLRREQVLGYCYVAMVTSITVLFVIYLAYLRGLVENPADATYGSSFSLTLPHIVEGLSYYISNFSDMFGPLAPAAVTGLLLVLIHLWKHRSTDEKNILLFLIIYLLAFAACAIVVYLPWNNRLPRYMLTSHFAIVLLIGILGTSAFTNLSKIWRHSKVNLLWLVPGALLTFTHPAILCVVFALLAFSVFWRKHASQYLIPMGAAVVGILYIVYTAPALRSSMNNFYVGREFANWQITMTVLKLSAEGKTVCFAGDVVDEHLGSMAGHINRTGIEPLIRQHGTEQCPPGSYLLINKWLSPAESNSLVEDRPLINSFNLPQENFNVPVGFWAFRKSIVTSDTANLPYETWETDYVWRLYGPA